ncbi:sigma-70 family RNA polymerase sigma factor [Pedobacter gandavensis]|uniref:sigma-70 family RNA polymerase sigma factor n=1 Tax=Pedobacter gandavensis TaxID=2679963 RepID=UPI002930DD45|nr:sigma-70 family RNA polymerase sigma factor [Pedobacter gandavensis]
MAVTPLENEKYILAKVAEGDERAFAELFHWYSKPLAEFVFKLTASLDQTEEIIQDSFVKIWLRRETLTEITNFSGYLYILCRNETFLVLKKIAAKSVSHAAFEKEILHDLELEESENPIDDYRKLLELAVDKLPEQQQKVYKMSRYDRLKHDEIAKALQLSPETVKKHIQLAVQFIRKDLNGRVDLSIILVLTTAVILH